MANIQTSHPKDQNPIDQGEESLEIWEKNGRFIDGVKKN